VPLGSRRSGSRPATTSLAGKVVLVTRPHEQSDALVRRLRAAGAEPIVAPTIEIVPARSAALTRALTDLRAGEYAWITITSRATVSVLSDRIAPRDVRAKVAVVGNGTGEAFRRWAHRSPDLVPRSFTTRALARAFPRGDGRVLCSRADIAAEDLENELAAKGWRPDRVDIYRTRMTRALPGDARAALNEGRVDAITFTSASTVRGFVGALRALKGNPKVVCIGPVTAREAREHGMRVSTVARPHTTDGVVDALERAFRPRGARRPSGRESS
jgi:uroporphyrinogen-III synthase